jgi:hypothetical protein
MKQLSLWLIGVVCAEDMFYSETISNSLDGITTTLLKDADDVPIWEIETKTYYDLDTGYRWLRVTHTLTANIAADDIVQFELAFSSDFDPIVDA